MKSSVFKLFYTFIFVFSLSGIYAQHPFTVVIDAGHGGHDSGAVGRYSKEKNLNLAVSLDLGEKIKQNYPDVKVVFTRKTDIFLPLQERADIVNNNKADIFFCIHTNSTGNSKTTGTETYALRVNGKRTKGNLDVAMRENSVMMLEDDYKTRYQGFDPNSVDSYIMFEYMQDKYIDKSVELANLVEEQFSKVDRRSRGVQQAEFWVLYKSACPSVLIEMGFISNKSEEDFLNSSAGQEKIVNAIYKAFEIYKYNHDKKIGLNPEKPAAVIRNSHQEDENQGKNEINKPDSDKNDVVKNETPEPMKNSAPNNISNYSASDKSGSSERNISSKNSVVFKIQILASKYKLGAKASDFKGLRNLDYYRDEKLYKYTYGEETDYDKIEKLRKSISKKFPKAYVIAFKGDKRIAVSEALKNKK